MLWASPGAETGPEGDVLQTPLFILPSRSFCFHPHLPSWPLPSSYRFLFLPHPRLWKWEGGLACSCAPPAVTPRGGPGVVRWGWSPNLHLPEEAGSREHPRLTSVTRGTRVQGTAGARQAPCLPSRGPGTAVQLSATVAWLPQRWGPVGGAGGLAIAFRLSLLLLF